MPEPLYRSCPGGFEIKPASQPRASRIAEFVCLSADFYNTFPMGIGDARQDFWLYSWPSHQSCTLGAAPGNT